MQCYLSPLSVKLHPPSHITLTEDGVEAGTCSFSTFIDAGLHLLEKTAQ